MYILETHKRQVGLQGVKNPQFEQNKGNSSADNTLHLQLGNICCALKCPDDEVYSWLHPLYREFETEQPVDITIELETTDRLSLKKLETAVSKTKYISKNGKSFKTTSKIISGQYDPIRRFIKITGERNLANPDLNINHLNRLLSLAYYSGCKVKYNNIPPAMLVQTCGVLRHGHALLFTGPNGAGKTTIARFCGAQDGEVINDEMVLVSRSGQNGNGINVQSAPMLGTFPPQRNVTARLYCIFLLKQGNKTFARILSQTEAYLRFMHQIISPAYISHKDKRTIFATMADFSNQVTCTIPVYELEFALDAESLWQTVGDIERAEQKKSQ